MPACANADDARASEQASPAAVASAISRLLQLRRQNSRMLVRSYDGRSLKYLSLE
jgi:hypothetical protein